jgi:hypothetical protein
MTLPERCVYTHAPVQIDDPWNPRPTIRRSVPQTLNSMLKQPARATHTPLGLEVCSTTHARSDLGKQKSRFSDKRLRGIADPNITRSSCNCEPEDGVQHLVLNNRDQPLGNGGRRTIDTIVDQLWICNCLQNWIHISHNRCPGNLLRCTVRTHSGVSSPAQ